MKATIWHNPRCGTSRTTLAALEQVSGIALTVVDYLKTPPDQATLARLYAQAGMRPADGLRRKEEGASGLVDADDATVLGAMASHPILIERPLVETDKGVRLCRPADRLNEIL